MDLTQIANSINWPVVLLVCGGLCVVGVILLFALNIIGTLFGAAGTLLSLGTDVVTGGPVTWCGCLVLLALLVICGGALLLIGSALATCGMPNAVNLCALFGR